MPSPDPGTRRQIARLGGLARSAAYDGREVTAAARDAFLSKFERDVDPDGRLEPVERLRRATAARKAHMQRLALQQCQGSQEGETVNPPADPETLLRVPDVARRLQISRASAYQLIQDGVIPSVRLGPKMVRVRPESLAAFVEDREQGR